MICPLICPRSGIGRSKPTEATPTVTPRSPPTARRRPPSAATPLDGFNTGFFMCGVIMLVGGAIAMAFVNPEREAKRRSRRLQPLTAFT